MGICHLIIKDNFIGRADEECYLPAWVYNLTDRSSRINQTKETLFPDQFIGLSDREIFESILKANQFPEEFHSDFLYLPLFNNTIWQKHNFTIDETIDGFLMYFYVKDDQLTFLIEDNTANTASDQRSYKFIFHSINIDFFLRTIGDAINFLVKEYPFLENQISKRTFNIS